MSSLKAWVLLWLAYLVYPVLCDPPLSCHCYPIHQALLCHWRRVHYTHVDVCLLFLISELQAKYYNPRNANILEMQKYIEAECVFPYKMVTIQNIPYTNFIKYQHRFSFSFSQDLTDSRGSGNSSQRNTTLNILLNDSEKQPEFSSLALE